MPLSRWRIPTSVYETLHLSAEAYGGVGAGTTLMHRQPYCILGHAGKVLPSSGYLPYPPDAESRVHRNDVAVRGHNVTHGRKPNTRVPFDIWSRIVNAEPYDDGTEEYGSAWMTEADLAEWRKQHGLS